MEQKKMKAREAVSVIKQKICRVNILRKFAKASPIPPETMFKNVKRAFKVLIYLGIAIIFPFLFAGIIWLMWTISPCVPKDHETQTWQMKKHLSQNMSNPEFPSAEPLFG